MEKEIHDLYTNPAKNLTTPKLLYDHFKEHNKNYTLKAIKDHLGTYEINQVLTKRRGDISFVADGPLQQFQIDLIYMPKSWFNNGYKYIFACVDVFSKKADMIPLKDREQTTSTNAFSKILSNMGIPKTIYSDQGSEFKNNTFQALLDKHKIQIIFALGHAPFVESFNRTMKNRMTKYMKLIGTDNWSKIIAPVLSAYNNTKHTSTGIAPNDINKGNEVLARMHMSKKAKKGNYPVLEVGDSVRVPVIHKQHKGYKEHWTTETSTLEKKMRGLYTVDGILHPRKDLQLVKGNIIKAPVKTKAAQNKRDNMDKIGKAQDNPEVKDLIGVRSKKATKANLDVGIQTRSQGRVLRSNSKGI